MMNRHGDASVAERKAALYERFRTGALILAISSAFIATYVSQIVGFVLALVAMVFILYDLFVVEMRDVPRRTTAESTAEPAIAQTSAE